MWQALQQSGVLEDRPETKIAEGWMRLSGPPAKRDYTAAAHLARSALDRDPLQSRALALLAVIDEQRGETARTAILMKAAGRLSRRNDAADYWLFNHAMTEADYETAMRHADALLRRRFVQVGPSVYSRMLMSAGDPSLVEALAGRLAKNPEWRPYFFAYAVQALRNPSALFPIYSAMQKAGSTPTAAELHPYLRTLVGAQKYEEAYLAWIVFLPQSTVSKLQNIYDGGFEGWPETPPFGWQLGEGVSGSIEPADAHNRDGYALMVDFDGLRLPKLPRQLLILPPGDYRFSGQVLTANPDSPGHMEWTLTCDSGAIMAGQPAPDTKGRWMPFSAAFSVPEDCKGQWLGLSPIPAERRADIEIWYDDLAIERAEPAS